MSDSTTLTVELSKELNDRLEAVATNANTSKAKLAAHAITTWIEEEERITALIRDRIAQADAGGPFVDHEDMVKYMRSLGTGRELPPPRAVLRKG